MEGVDETTSFKDRMESTPLSSGALPELMIRRHLYTQAAIDEIYEDRASPRRLCDVLKDTFRVSPGCIRERALGFLPIVRTIHTYQWRQWLVADLISGLSTGFIHLPQGLGFGLLASLQPIHGLYTSFFPVLIYLLFGTSPHVSFGTNALIALLTASLVESRAEGMVMMQASLSVNRTLGSEELMEYKVGIASAACFVSGLILFAMGVARMGVLTNFMSKSFIGGFTFAAAVHITISQVIKLLNVQLPGRSGLGKLVMTFIDICHNLGDANPADIVVGLVCMGVLLGVKIGINEHLRHKLKLPVPVDLIVVIVSTIISHFAHLHRRFGLAVVGQVPTGLPAPAVPPWGSLPEVAAEAFVMAILTFALTISLARLTAKIHDVSIDANQELVAYGLCQLVGAFFQNFASCTAPPRTMVLSSMRSRSTLNGVAPAVFILLMVVVAGQQFESLPIAMLAAMIIVAMKDLLLQIRTLRSLWTINKPDFFIWVLTAAFGVFLNLDIGLLVGVIVSMVTVLLVSQMAEGKLLGKAENEDVIIDLERKGVYPVPGVKIFRFQSALYYASLDRFRTQLFTQVMNPSLAPKRPSLSTHPHPDENLGTNLDPSPTHRQDEPTDVIHHVILDCGAVSYVDVAGVELLQTVVGKLGRAGLEVCMANVPVATLVTLKRAGFYESLGPEKVFYSVEDALQTLKKPELLQVKM